MLDTDTRTERAIAEAWLQVYGERWRVKQATTILTKAIEDVLTCP